MKRASGTAERPAGFEFWIPAVLLLTLLSAAFFFLHFQSYSRPIDGWFPGIFNDYKNVWLAGRLWEARDFAVLTDPEAFNAYRAERFPGDTAHIWSYPLHFILLTWPFSRLPFLTSAFVWTGLGLLAYLVLARRLRQTNPFALLLLLTSSGAFLTVVFGQASFFFAFLLWTGLLIAPVFPIMAGLLLGILSVKPQLLLFAGLLLLLTGRFRVIAVAAGTGLALVLATLPLIGTEPWTLLFTVTAPAQTEHMFRFAQQSYSLSWFGGIERVTGSRTLAAILQVVATLGAALVLVAAARSRKDWREKVDATILLTFVGLPYLLSYDLLLLLPLTVKIVTDRAGFSVPHRLTALLVAGAGPLGVILSALQFFPWSQTLLLLLAVLHLRRFFRLPDERLTSAVVPGSDPIPARGV